QRGVLVVGRRLHYDLLLGLALHPPDRLLATALIHQTGPAARPMRAPDAEAVRAIYAEGIAERIATFETQAPNADRVAGWVSAFRVVVVEDADGRVVGWASAPAYRPARPVYAGVREFSVYVARDARGRGVGELALRALLNACRAAGHRKLVSRI